MSGRTRRTTTSDVIRLLSEADRFSRLAKASPRASKRRFYRRKDRFLIEAIRRGHEGFRVDSLLPGRRLALGLTHVASGRQVHVFPYRLAFDVQVLLHKLAWSGGFGYPFLAIAGELADQDGLAARLEALCHVRQGEAVNR